MKGMDSFDAFQQELKVIEDNIVFVDMNVSMDKQMEFYRFCENVSDVTPPPVVVEEQMEVLNNPESSEDNKKYALAYMAISGNVEAYRALEEYGKEHDDDWTKLAIMKCKIAVENEFNDEPKCYITTGLGSKGKLLRFFIFIKTKDLDPFETWQSNLVEKEFKSAINSKGGEVEEFTTGSNYITSTFLIGLKVNIKEIFDNIIYECNEYGGFLENTYIVTNVMKLQHEDIDKETKKE